MSKVSQVEQAFVEIAEALSSQLNDQSIDYCELINPTILMQRVMRKDFEACDKEMYAASVRLIDAMKNNVAIDDGVYRTDAYFDAFEYVHKLCERIMTENEELIYQELVTSRRLLFVFKPEHCFTSIQFLFRHAEKDSDDAIVIANMRSCNCEKNLFTDLLIVYTLCEMLKEAYIKRFPGYFVLEEGVTLHMNIGSLHYFK